MPLQLAAVIFLTVSGGPYGLEQLYAGVGIDGALFLLLVTPILWDIPTILTVLELNSLMPVTGGYYQWVRYALGLRWAFFEGWWTWLYTFLDLAIYPVLFVTYTSFFFPEVLHYRLPICLVIIWASAILNILGIVPVGKVSLLLGAMVVVPFLVMFGWLTHTGHAFSIPAPSLKGTPFSALSLGIYYVMWNFLGWDNATTYAGEVNQPVRSYIRSIGLAFLLILGVYLLTTLSVHWSGIDPGTLDSENRGFPLLGTAIGGRWLGILVAVGGMASQMGLYAAVLLSVSRVPQVMADDQLLPSWFCSLHPRFKTPYVSILVSSAIVSVLVLFTFSDLVVMDIILYGAGLFLEFLALLILRKREPDRPRPFRIPLPIPGLICMIALPVAVYMVALWGTIYSAEKMWGPVALALGMLVSAPFAWRLIRRRNPNLA
ncbi:MAG TPA: APC family permease [Puia sp.]|nr:APC family permease [Puia sp.]